MIPHCCWHVSNKWAPTPAATNRGESFPIIVKPLMGDGIRTGKKECHRCAKGYRICKTGNQRYTRASCPAAQCSSPAPTLIPRRNKEWLHPYFCGKEFELCEHREILTWKKKILLGKCRGKSQIVPHRPFYIWFPCLKSNRPVEITLILPKWTFDHEYLNFHHLVPCEVI